MAKPWQNSSGCNDPTAYAATKPITEEEKQVADLVKLIKTMAHLSGYEIINRMEVRNRNSGRTYR